MHVFVTGASGHIGSALVPQLLDAGHQVVGLARSDASAAAVAALGAKVHRGDLDDLDGLRKAAASADGVVHLAFKPLSEGDIAGAIAADLRAVEAIGGTLAGSDRPFVIAAATMMLALGDITGRGGVAGRPGTELDVLPGGPRADTENMVIGLAERGVRSSVVRLASLVHSSLDRHGLTPMLIAIARTTGVSGYVAEGTNRWPAVHTFDAACLFALALERAPAGSRLHGVAEQGIPFREIAEALGRRLDVPAESVAAEYAGAHFGDLGTFVPLDNPTSSAHTRELLGWQPVHPGFVEDVDEGHYAG